MQKFCEQDLSEVSNEAYEVMDKIGFGGSCHWCTEAIFETLRRVSHVDQGWVSGVGHELYSEAVVVNYDEQIIALEVLIEIHLYSHSCTSQHVMREKYRSAVYTFDEDQQQRARSTIIVLQEQFDSSIITEVIPFLYFRRNEEKYLQYYSSDPDKPFCKNVINPKLRMLRKRYGKLIKSN